MLKLLVITKGAAVVCSVLYMVGVVLFYFSKDQSVFSGGSWIAGLLFQYIGFYVSLIGVAIGATLYFFSKGEGYTIGWYYYPMALLILLNIFCVSYLYIRDTMKYPNNMSTVSSYIRMIPTGITSLLLDTSRK